MQINVEKLDKERTRISIVGGMTIYHAAALKEGLLSPLAEGRELEVDLSGVHEIDTVGLQVLVLAKREAAVQDKTLRLTGHNQAVVELLDQSNLEAFFGDPVLLHSHA